MKVSVEKDTETEETGSSGTHTVHPETNSGSGNDSATKTGRGREDTNPGAAKTLEDLINDHIQEHPEEEEEEDEQPQEPTGAKPNDPQKSKEDEKTNRLINDLFIGAFLVRIVNRLFTFINVLLFNMIMRRKGIMVDFDKVMLTEQEMKPMYILMDKYGAALIQKYLPPWVQALMIIEGTYMDKMLMFKEPIK